MKVNNSKITSLIKGFVGKQKYLVPDDVETYKDSTDLIFNIKDDLIDSARDSMKDVLENLTITVHIMDWGDIIEVSIYGNTDDWGSFSIDKGEFNEDELNVFLDKYIGDEVLLDNAKNNNTWEESLEEDDYISDWFVKNDIDNVYYNHKGDKIFESDFELNGRWVFVPHDRPSKRKVFKTLDDAMKYANGLYGNLSEAKDTIYSIAINQINKSNKYRLTIVTQDSETRLLDVDKDKVKSAISNFKKDNPNVKIDDPSRVLKEGIYDFSEADKKAIIQWWKDISEIEDNYVDVSKIDKAFEDDDEFFAWFAAMYDVLNDLRYNHMPEDDGERVRLTNLYKRGKRLYNKYALSQFREGLKENFVKSPLDYIEDKLQEEGIEYEVEQAWGDAPYDTWITILDGQDNKADDIICSVVGQAYDWVRDKDSNRKYCKVATNEETIDELNESLKEGKEFHNYKEKIINAKTKEELRKIKDELVKDQTISDEDAEKLFKLYCETLKDLDESLKEASSNDKEIYDIDCDTQRFGNWVRVELSNGEELYAPDTRVYYNYDKGITFEAAVRQVLAQKYGYKVPYKNLLSDEEVQHAKIDLIRYFSQGAIVDELAKRLNLSDKEKKDLGDKVVYSGMTSDATYNKWVKRIIDTTNDKQLAKEFLVASGYYDTVGHEYLDGHPYLKEDLDDYSNRWERLARGRGTTKFTVDGYYDNKYRGLADTKTFEDGDEAREYVWELLQKGNYVKVNGFNRLSPYDVEEPEDIPYEWFMEGLKEDKDFIPREVTTAVDLEGNEYHVKPIWASDRLATLVDKDGNKIKVDMGEWREYYTLYDQDGYVISSPKDFDESLLDKWL